MPKTASTTTAKKPPAKKAGKKTTGEILVIDTPTKKQRVAPTRFSVDAARCFTVNPYVVGGKNKIDIVLHEGGSPTKDAQPQVTLLPGGRTLSVQWKIREELFSELQASTQGIESNSSRSIAYSDTMQLMVSAGIRAVEGYYRGTPQLIQLPVECTGSPKVRILDVPTKKKVWWAGKAHMQFNCMYVCTVRVATDRHGLTAQPKNAGFADFGFLESSAEADRGGGGHGENSDGGGAAAAAVGGGGGGGAYYPVESESDDSYD